MTKAQQVRELLKRGLADIDIAQRVGSPESYIRTVRQRTDARGRARNSPGDLKWRPTSNQRRRQWYVADPTWRQRKLEITARSRAKRRAEARAP
jgi:hypothetical protein